jgi:hypothetical protein
MPAARKCANCGATLSGDVRWCGLCAAPVREFTPRAALHRGDFVGSPISTGGYRPRWSRWEQSATTFGPLGRIVATGLFFLSALLIVGLGNFFFILAFALLIVPVMGGIWATGWVVPDEPDPTQPVEEHSPDVSEKPPVVLEPLTIAQRIWRASTWALGLGLVLAIAYGPLQARAVALALGAILGFVWFWRSFLSS